MEEAFLAQLRLRFRAIVTFGTGDLLAEVLLVLQYCLRGTGELDVRQWAREFCAHLKRQLVRLRQTDYPPARSEYLNVCDRCIQELEAVARSGSQAAGVEALLRAVDYLHGEMHAGNGFALSFRHPLHRDAHVTHAYSVVGQDHSAQRRLAEELVQAAQIESCPLPTLIELGWRHYDSMGLPVREDEPYLPR